MACEYLFVIPKSDDYDIDSDLLLFFTPSYYLFIPAKLLDKWKDKKKWSLDHYEVNGIPVGRDVLLCKSNLMVGFIEAIMREIGNERKSKFCWLLIEQSSKNSSHIIQHNS